MQFWKDLTLPFYGYNRPGAKISEGVRDASWRQGMTCGMPGAYFCIKAFSETDLSGDLEKRSFAVDSAHRSTASRSQPSARGLTRTVAEQS